MSTGKFFQELTDNLGNYEIFDDDGSHAFKLSDVITDEPGEPSMNEVMAKGVYELIIKHRIALKPPKQKFEPVTPETPCCIPVNDLVSKHDEILLAVMYCLTLDSPVWPENWPKKYRIKIDERKECGRYEIAIQLLACEILRLKNEIKNNHGKHNQSIQFNR